MERNTANRQPTDPPTDRPTDRPSDQLTGQGKLVFQIELMIELKSCEALLSVFLFEKDALRQL